MNLQNLTWLFITLIASTEVLLAVVIWGKELSMMYAEGRNGSMRSLAFLFSGGLFFLAFSSILASMLSSTFS